MDVKQDSTQQMQQSEWCVDEKHTMLQHMAAEHPTEYTNIMRLEQNNF